MVNVRTELTKKLVNIKEIRIIFKNEKYSLSFFEREGWGVRKISV